MNRGVTHYAEECPANKETHSVEIQPPPSEQQIEEAKKRYVAVLKERATQSGRASKPRRFRSLSLDELGPLPENAKSTYLVTEYTGLTFKLKEKVGQFNLTLKAKKGLSRGALLEAHFPDPSNPARKDIVEEVLLEEEETIPFVSSLSGGFKCWNYEVEVFVYSNETKSELLGTHIQTIQSRTDLNLARDSMDTVRAITGTKCPSIRQNEVSQTSWADVKCPRANRMKYVRNLEKLCEEARQRKIKPLREAKVEDCIKKQKKDTEWCKRYLADSFHAKSPPSRGFIGKRLFDDLPECVAFYKCRFEAHMAYE